MNIERTPDVPREPLEKLPFDAKDCALERALSASLLAARETPGYVTLDGIGYELWHANDDCRAKFQFGNPRPGPWREVEAGVMNACRMIADRSVRRRVRAWLPVFEKYFRRS
ncbi:MAG: hypothetical protein IT452_21385 [Planctomycetia bacterium]|nr:hypothetical protein [Planctomycetia bacterium]